jgi:hypothetical protein
MLESMRILFSWSAVVAAAALGCASSQPEARTDTPSVQSAPPTRDPCARVTCPAGQRCAAADDKPACVAVPASAPPSRDPCSSFTCPTGQRCVAPDDRPRCVAGP